MANGLDHQGGNTLVVSLLYLVAGTSPFLGWFREYERPTRLEITDEGIALDFRRGYSRVVRWDSEFALKTTEGDPTTSIGRLKRGGVLKPKNHWLNHHLTYEMAKAVQEAYHTRMGEYPPRKVRN